MKRIVGMMVLVASVSACAVIERDRTADVSAFAAGDRSADCDRAARRATSPEETTASAPWSGTPWTDAREWTVATASSKAQIERDIRNFMYRDCLDARR
jgi:hypothetical protein